jgi:hypothetical protein
MPGQECKTQIAVNNHFTSVIEKFDSDLWGHHLVVPNDVALHFVQTTGRRVVCTLEGTVTFHCALMQLSGGRYFININKANRDKLGLVVGQEVSAVIVPDESPYGLPMSEEFEEVLRQDEEGSTKFHALTPGLQRSLIYFSDNVKSSHIKVRRALVVINHLHLHDGKVDFKALTEEVKEANRAERRL